MNKSITQANQNDKQISKSIKKFFKRFHISSALKASNAYKKNGIPVIEIFQYLFLLIFSNRSMYMSLITGRNTPGFAKDTVYRFMKMLQINWIRFTTLLASRIIRDAIVPLDSEDRANVLIIDDSMFERNRSKKVELLAKAYDHANHRYRFGFRMLTLGWSDGSSFLPVNSILLSSENKKNRVNEAVKVDKRTAGYKRRLLSIQKGTQAMLELLKTAKKAAVPAKYVLFDSWFSSPSTLHAVKTIGYDVIGMVKKTPKMFFRYKGEDMSLITIYNRNKKRRGRSRYLLSVLVDVVKDGKVIPAKVVYVRNRNKRKEYLCLISTDTTLDENEIIRIYGKRWDIEVFFKVCKSYLNLSRECNSLSYDAMTAHTAVVFTRYMMLSLESREGSDNRSLGELFLYFSDEMSDITWIQAFRMLLQMFRTILNNNTELSDDKIDELVDTFMNTLPALLKAQLQAA
ncbi:IS4 family transposase ISGur1 [Schaedlerella arabinosiphila]|nr:IS4 family transposase ISGur1 [Schaedlerella arabinosiphila]KAI4443226.1 IS4 family transposase ISGur1 [Schaedlerella arabinosiphila]KAI4443252.1 IS4 family transposase ISGur1 [Schaedlerella arabinosiphila]KAI4444276.1 IS4 family transposase ISGur1 [Schaedlerella arabinosiphila]